MAVAVFGVVVCGAGCRAAGGGDRDGRRKRREEWQQNVAAENKKVCGSGRGGNTIGAAEADGMYMVISAGGYGSMVKVYQCLSCDDDGSGCQWSVTVAVTAGGSEWQRGAASSEWQRVAASGSEWAGGGGGRR